MSSEREVDIHVLDTLRQYVRSKHPGDILDYVSVTQDTGVSMLVDSGGRDLLRVALRAERIDYRSIRDVGVEISSPTNACSFAQHGAASVLRKSHRERKRVNRLIARHGLDSSMPERDKQAMLAIGAFHGAIETAGSCAMAGKTISVTKPPSPKLPR